MQNRIVSTIVVGILCLSMCAAVLPQAYAGRVIFVPPTFEAELVDYFPTSSDYYGSAIAVGDGLIVVGAYREGDTHEGLAYVYNATTGECKTILESSTPQADGHFGMSVAIGDGLIFVGAPWEDEEGYNATTGSNYHYAHAGHIHVYNATTWQHVNTWNASEIGSHFSPYYAYLGTSLAYFNHTLVVGASVERMNFSMIPGFAYIIKNIDSDGMGYEGSLTLSSANPTNNGEFGHSVAISDGYVVVGAPVENSSDMINEAGNAYIFSAIDGTLLKTLTSSQVEAYFGGSVAISGGKVVVGAPYASVKAGKNTFLGAGKAYIFSVSGKLTKTLVSPNLQDYSSFGISVAAAGNIVVVGSQNEDIAPSLNDEGRAYIFSTRGKVLATLTEPTPVAQDSFGNKVATDGTNVVVAAIGYAGNQFLGRVFLFN